ncbi:MAG: GNAT family N-acetyltransferase [Anaerolineales bacterium]|nr:GNAT family N-acetyltransferase [Anaerolineales bacterium]
MFIIQQWGANLVVAHGDIYYPHMLPGFLAEKDSLPVGLVTYHMDGAACEIVTLDSLQPGMGIGSALVTAVQHAARQANCTKLWLITTNDNLHALGFYQKRGFELARIHRHAITQSRQRKPSIPLLGSNNIPIRDEIELEMPL